MAGLDGGLAFGGGARGLDAAWMFARHPAEQVPDIRLGADRLAAVDGAL
jgi:hypothetical protein